MHQLNCYILSIIFLVISSTIQSQDRGVFRAGLDDGDELMPYLSIYEDKNETLAALDFDSIWNMPVFEPIEKSNLTAQSYIDYWCKLQISNADMAMIANTDWVLEFDVGITEMDAYVRSGKEDVQQHTTGYFVPLSQRTFAPTVKANLIKININKGESADILLRFKNERRTLPPKFNVLLKKADDYAKELRISKQWNMLYLGFVLMILVYNLFVFSFKSDRANIDYSLYLFFVAFHTSYNVGDVHDIIQDIITPNRPEFMYFFKLSAYIALMCYLSFIRYFLNLKDLLPTWDKVFKWFIWIAIPFLVVDGLLMSFSNYSPNVSDFATIGYCLFFILLTTFFLIPLRATTDVKRHFIFWGVLAMNFGLFVTVALRLQSYDFSILAFKIGSIVEIIIFSIGLVYRQKEQELSQREMEFELEKSKLIQEQEHSESLRLAELNDFKSTVYANITHEFRTPLTVILGMADRLESYPREQNLIKRNSNDLLQLINRMLDMSRAESDQLILHPIEDDFLQYANYLFESIISAAQAKNIAVKLKSNREQIFMLYDESAIKHILDNLLTNAIKFTPNNGHVTLQILELTGEPPELQIIVSDDGIGIAKEEHEKIFSRFYQSLAGNAQSVRGSGLGLSLVKEFVVKLGGRIKVESELQKGAKFIITLPITRHQDANKESTISSTTHEEESTLIVAEDPRPIVLLVEDNLDVLEYIGSCFEDRYIVITSQNGKEGLEMAVTHIPDIIVSDLMMPIMDGVELCNALKQDQRTSHIPIILLTARTARNSRLDALKQGIEAYITKPFDKEELLVRVEQLIQLRNNLRDLYQKGLDMQIVSGGDPFMRDLNEFIISRMDDTSLQLEDIQNWSGMSKTQLYRKIKVLTDLSAIQYVSHVRFEEAKRFLKIGDLSISQIAYRVGYSDPNYFTRKFTQLFGMTPKEYRNVSESA